jgi:hypothetical protein
MFAHILVTCSAPSSVVELEGGNKVLNFASTNFLGMAEDPEVKVPSIWQPPFPPLSFLPIFTQPLPATQQTAVSALQTYGCGSCGPRGFYGTMGTQRTLDLLDANRGLHTHHLLLLFFFLSV